MADDDRPLRPPTEAEVQKYASNHYLDLDDDELSFLTDVVTDRLGAYQRVRALAEPEPPRATTRGDRKTTERENDPLNAFATGCTVAGAEHGPLAGYEIGLKDNISLADIEMRCGTTMLSGYVPSYDATVVRRLLDTGGTIVGKMTMEPMALSGSGELSASGVVRNGYDSSYVAGGSSSGSAAAVAGGGVDVALGTDQGGSIRLPAAWNGCVGYKPTYGLLPYTGIVGLGYSFDHVGPICSTVADCARVVDVLAGDDPLDPRQEQSSNAVYSTEEALSTDLTDVSVGVLSNGFRGRASDTGVETTVRDALARFETEGATLVDRSVSMHTDGLLLWNAILTEEVTALFDAEAVGHYVSGFYDTEFAKAFGEARREYASEFPPSLKAVLILGEYLADEFAGQFYSKAQNLLRDLTAAYDEALEDVDVLAMPTVLQTAHEIRDELSSEEALERSVNMIYNTPQFNVTGHPAISVPCGTHDGLPVGLMFVGRLREDETVLRVAHAFEQRVSVK